MILCKNERMGSNVHLKGPENLYNSPGTTKSRPNQSPTARPAAPNAMKSGAYIT